MLPENFFRYCLFNPSCLSLKDLFFYVGVLQDVQAGFKSGGAAAAVDG